jgi:hypothetical protein
MAAIVDDVDKVDSEIRLSLDSRHRWALNQRTPPRGCQSQAGIGWNLRAEVEPSDAPIEELG